jgi:signal transduction histidine kinase
MKKIWGYVSKLGTDNSSSLPSKVIIQTNQLNFLMFSAMVLLMLVLTVLRIAEKEEMYIGTLRVLILLFATLLNLVLAGFGCVKFSRLSLIFIPSIVFILGPTITGYVEPESFFYYPYVLISGSIIPLLLVDPLKEKTLFSISILYFFILMLSIEEIMRFFVDNDLISKTDGGYMSQIKEISKVISSNPFIKIAQAGIFVFINASIYYMRKLNYYYEEVLSSKNLALGIQNTLLERQKAEIEMHKDELIAKEIGTWQKLVSIVSHEIVNSVIPITNLAGMSRQMLEDETGNVMKPDQITTDVTTDLHFSLGVIETRTAALVNFVRATKSLTRIPQPSMRNILITDLFERVSGLYLGRFREKGISLRKEILPAGLSLSADLELLEQVLINLIQNAIDAMDGISNPELVLSACVDESGQVRISVTDNGPGIRKENLDKIFIPFFSTKNHNSGIGLSLSRQIMQMHHGSIEVSSQDGRGAVFSMVF